MVGFEKAPGPVKVIKDQIQYRSQSLLNLAHDYFNRMEIVHVLFSSNTYNMSDTCQKLAFTHPIVVLKSGLKNNWMKKLDRVNRL